jgi:hypothetical protein
MPPTGTNYEKFSETLQEVLSCVTTIQTELRHVAEVAEETRRTLRGSNGDVGLVARVNAIEQADVAGKIAEIRTVLDGNCDAPGLLERVRILEALARNIRSAAYLVGGLLVTDIVTRLWPGILQALNK